MEQTNASTLENQIEPQYIISANKFALLCFITFGFYNIWWFYKSWRFFQQKENTDLAPAIRTIFGIVFMIPLFYRIINLAKRNGYDNTYSSGLLYILYLAATLFSYLPNPYWLISVFTFIILLPPFKALNFARIQNTIYNPIEQKSFNGRQIFLIVIGSIFWVLILISTFVLSLASDEYNYEAY